MPTIRVLQYDEDAMEAIAEIEIPMNEATPEHHVPIKVFCHPYFSPEANRKISLFGFLVTSIVSENTLQAPEKTNDGYFSYHLFAKVLDSGSRRVLLGDIEIILDCPVPQDISPNSYISFDVMRLDLQC